MAKSQARTRILAAASELFDQGGFDSVSVAAVCRAADVSNGSFFHAFPNKEALGGALFLEALLSYHRHVEAEASGSASDGLHRIIQAHADWVVRDHVKARFLFTHARDSWLDAIRMQQAEENDRFAKVIEAWRQPHVQTGQMVDLPLSMFLAQVIGPVQIFCRAWLAGRSSETPSDHAPVFAQAACRALLQE